MEGGSSRAEFTWRSCHARRLMPIVCKRIYRAGHPSACSTLHPSAHSHNLVARQIVIAAQLRLKRCARLTCPPAQRQPVGLRCDAMERCLVGKVLLGQLLGPSCPSGSYTCVQSRMNAAELRYFGKQPSKDQSSAISWSGWPVADLSDVQQGRASVMLALQMFAPAHAR